MALEIKNEKLFNTIVSEAIQNAITNCATEALAKRWERAIDRAVTEIQENPFLDYDGTEAHLLILSSSSNNIYSANGVCQCKAFDNGFPCWHRAAARIWRLYREAANKPLPKAVAVSSIQSFNNAPYLKNTQARKPARVGNVRI
jgi:hypothetical protein